MDSDAVKECEKSVSAPSVHGNTPQAQTQNVQYVGARVVRGQDWRWDKQDGGEGHVGTVRLFENEREVLIVWDKGTAANYRCSPGGYDLRILDTAQTGVQHEGSTCAGCAQQPIAGVLWQCVNCTDCVLCSVCYHSDKHSLKHTFYRIMEPDSERVLMEARKGSKKVSMRGCFVGARVVRGMDWVWDSQDGGQQHGKIVTIQNWSPTSFRSAAYVLWDNGMKNLYRLGFDGKMDVQCVGAAKGGSYYREHLALLGQQGTVPACQFSAGDSVRIELDLAQVRALQQQHGGWSDKMQECLTSVGIVQSEQDNHTVQVLYPSSNKWSLNGAMLVKVLPAQCATEDNDSDKGLHLRTTCANVPTENGVLVVGDSVTVCADVQRLQMLQKGHGEWTPAMNATLGQIGRVTHVYNDGDMKVHFGSVNASWTFNALALQRVRPVSVSDTSGHNHVAQNESSATHNEQSVVANVIEVKAEVGNGVVAAGHVKDTEQLIGLLRRLFQDKPCNIAGQLVKGAATGDHEQVQHILSEHRTVINTFYAGHTALQASCQNGHVRVVMCLLRAGANVQVADQDGDCALHHAALGNEPFVIELLHAHGADLNVRNARQQTALHLAVIKAHVRSAKMLMQLGAQTNLQDVDGDTPLHDAITKKRHDLLEQLLVYGADMNICNKHGLNALHHAAMFAHSSALRSLLGAMRQPWIVDEQKEDGYTALHLAALNNHVQVAQLLVTLGRADLNVKNANEQTALHLAVNKQHWQITRLLVRAGASVNACDQDGDSVLHEALRHHTLAQLHQLHPNTLTPQLVTDICLAPTGKQASANLATFLVKHGADLRLKNKKGQTALDFCPDPSLCRTLVHIQKQLLIKAKLGEHAAFNEKNARRQTSDNAQTETSKDCLNMDWSDGEDSESEERQSSIGSDQDNEQDIDSASDGEQSPCQPNPDVPGPDTKTDSAPLCLVCTEKMANILLVPCGHLAACEECAPHLQLCMQCKGPVTERRSVQNCVLCKEQPVAVVNRPCLHAVTCKNCGCELTECVECERQIQIDPKSAVPKTSVPELNNERVGVVLNRVQSSGGLHTMLKNELHPTFCARRSQSDGQSLNTTKATGTGTASAAHLSHELLQKQLNLTHLQDVIRI